MEFCRSPLPIEDHRGYFASGLAQSMQAHVLECHSATAAVPLTWWRAPGRPSTSRKQSTNVKSTLPSKSACNNGKTRAYSPNISTPRPVGF